MKNRKRGEQIVDVDKHAKMTPKEKKKHLALPAGVHVSISNQDSVLFESTKPFTVVGFVQTYPTPKGLPNPFTRDCPIKSIRGTGGMWRASTGPASTDQPPAVWKHLTKKPKKRGMRQGITYNSILADADGNPIDPHIEIVR